MTSKPVGNLPEGWTESLLGDVASCTLGGTPSTLVPNFWGGSIPWMASGDVHIRRVGNVPGRISEAGLAASNATLVDPPAVAVALAGQGKTRGKAALVNIKLCTNQSIALLKGEAEHLDTSYLFHALDHRYEELRARSSGGGRGGLSRRVLSEVPLCFPSLPEQRRIAQILDTLDEVIQRTEQFVAKLKQVKQGLLNDLLTRGIDENGELRDPERHPKQFKNSPLGQIPKAWDVVELGRTLASCGGFLQTGPFGSQLHAHEYVQGSGVPVVMPQDIDDDAYISTEDVARISPARAERLSRHKLEVNDVVFARRGDLSRCAAIGEREIGWICGTGCLLARFPVSAVGARWFSALYRHDWLQRQIAGRAVGSTMVNLNTGILAGLIVPLPLRMEQARIEEVIQEADRKYAAENKQLSKLRLLKQGLQEDLLTGRVRVTPLMNEAAP